MALFLLSGFTRLCAGLECGYARLSSLLRAKREPEKHQRFRRAGSDGLRYPASTSCLGRHSCPADRGPNSSSLFPPQAAVVAVARKGLLAPFRPRRGSRNGKKLAASLNAFFSFLRFTASPKILCLRKAKTESECEKELCGHQKERKIIKNQFKKPR